MKIGRNGFKEFINMRTDLKEALKTLNPKPETEDFGIKPHKKNYKMFESMINLIGSNAIWNPKNTKNCHFWCIDQKRKSNFIFFIFNHSLDLVENCYK